jgi:SAM-dependent methyltransferase
MKDYSLKSGERYSTLDLNCIGYDHILRYNHLIHREIEEQKESGNQQLFGADIFCGSGYGAAMIADSLNVFMLAIDGSFEAVKVAEEKVMRSNIIYAGKFFPFDLPENKFDFIASMESLEHVKDFKAFFATLVHALKNKGRLYISVPNENVMPYQGYVWHFKHFVPEEMRELATEFGLKEVFSASTACHLIHERNLKDGFIFPMKKDGFSSLDCGDTMFFEFIKE